MSTNFNVTATLDNQTTYTLNYESVSVSWGNYYNHHTSVSPGSSLEIFYAVGAEGAAAGCQGTVTWTFTDQNGNSQDFTLSYDNPYVGSNSYSESVPNGMTGSYSGGGGDSAVVTYTISGAVVTAGEEVPVSSGQSCQSA